jgi:hypothetical protein
MSFGYGWRGPNIVKDGLILYLDPGSPNSYYDKSGTTIKDISGNGNNGTLTNFGSQTIYNSSNGGSIVFDGSDDYVDLSTTLNSLTTTSSFSVDMWVLTSITLPNGLNYYGLISNWNNIGGTEKGFQLYWGGSDSLYAYGAGYLSQALGNITSLTANIWYNVTFVYTRGVSGRIYLNGVDKTFNSYTNLINTTATNLKIGIRSMDNALPWNGKISSTKIYNRALSQSEVLQNYNATKSRFGL